MAAVLPGTVRLPTRVGALNGHTSSNPRGASPAVRASYRCKAGFVVAESAVRQAAKVRQGLVVVAGQVRQVGVPAGKTCEKGAKWSGAQRTQRARVKR